MQDETQNTSASADSEDTRDGDRMKNELRAEGIEIEEDVVEPRDEHSDDDDEEDEAVSADEDME